MSWAITETNLLDFWAGGQSLGSLFYDAQIAQQVTVTPCPMSLIIIHYFTAFVHKNGTFLQNMPLLSISILPSQPSLLPSAKTKKKVTKPLFQGYLLPGSNCDIKARAFGRGLYSVVPRSKSWSILHFRKAKSYLRSSYENHWGYCTFKWTFPIRLMRRSLTGQCGRDWSLKFPALILGLCAYFICNLAGSLERTVWPPPPLTCTVVCHHSHTTCLHPNDREAALWHKISLLWFWLNELAKVFNFQAKTNLFRLPDRLPFTHHMALVSPQTFMSIFILVSTSAK